MWSEWWNRFIASDPALRRLRTTTRVTASVVITLLIMFPLLAWWSQPLSNAIVGAVVAIQSCVAVKDETDRQRRITTLLMPFPAIASLTLATVTQPLPVVKILVFLVVIFTATYIRRFGARYFALGFVGFFGYFFAMFLTPTLPQVPAMALGAICGAAAAFVLRFAVLRDDPEGILDRARRTLRAEVHRLLHAVGDFARNPRSQQRRRELQNRSTRLNETALMVETTVQQLTSLPESGRELLRQRVLDVELAAENLLPPLRQIVDQPSSIEVVHRALGPVLGMVRTDPFEIREAGRRAAERVEQEDSAEMALSVRRFSAGLAELARATSELGKPHPRAEQEDDRSTRESTDEQQSDEQQSDEQRSEDQRARESEQKRVTTEETGLRRPEVRTAVQVTCATAMAIIGGQLVSPNRWYWAVITAFVVFISTNSRGELLVRAWQRTLGTMLGVLAGILVAAQVTGNIVAEFGLVVLCVFLAFYFLGYAYAMVTFFITTMLGIVYGILGFFDPSVLGTRLIETAIGAASGVLASSVILPTRTRSVIRSRSQDFLLQLRDLLRGFGTDIHVSGTVTGMREPVRELDDRVQQLLSSARPLTNYRLRTQRSRLERSLTIIGGCAHYVRNLAVVLPDATEMVDEDTRDRLAELLWALADAAESLTDEGARDFEAAAGAVREQAESLHDIAESLQTGPTSLHHSINLLDRVGQTLRDLAGEFEVPRERQESVSRP